MNSQSVPHMEYCFIRMICVKHVKVSWTSERALQYIQSKDNRCYSQSSSCCTFLLCSAAKTECGQGLSWGYQEIKHPNLADHSGGKISARAFKLTKFSMYNIKIVVCLTKETDLPVTWTSNSQVTCKQTLFPNPLSSLSSRFESRQQLDCMTCKLDAELSKCAYPT